MTSIHRILTEIATAPRGDAGPHLTNEQLIAYADGSLSQDQLPGCEHHLAHCAECCCIVERLAEAESHKDRPPPFPIFVPELSVVLESNADPRPVEAKATDASHLRLVTAEPGAAATGTPLPPAASQFKGLSLLLSEYRSANRRTIAKVAGETLTMQDFNNPAGYPLETHQGEMRFYCNLREHNGTTDIAFALRLPEAASPVSIRWERYFADTGKPPNVRVLTFTSNATRLEFPSMERPDDSERWCFECVDTGGAS